MKPRHRKYPVPYKRLTSVGIPTETWIKLKLMATARDEPLMSIVASLVEELWEKEKLSPPNTRTHERVMRIAREFVEKRATVFDSIPQD